MLKCSPILCKASSSSSRTTSSFRIFQTHHLLSNQKKATVRDTCLKHGVSALVRTGYPGIILLFARGSGGEDQVGVKNVCEKIASLRWASQNWHPLETISPANFTALYDTISERLDATSKRESQATSPKSRMLIVEKMKDMSQVFKDSTSADSSDIPWMEIWQRHMKPSAPGQEVSATSSGAHETPSASEAATSSRQQRKQQQRRGG